jgi:photosystem II stability/assembly factor-like uncharacterized protein
VTERVRRWVNRPGVEPEVLASGTCDEKRRQCDFDVSWAHPAKLDPKRLDLTLDGVSVWHGKERHATVPLAKGAKPQVLVLDAQFSDGTRASYTRTLFAFYPEVAQAALQAVPILQASGTPPDASAEALRDAGWPVRIVEEAEPEIAFVVEPRVFEIVPSLKAKAFDGNAYSSFASTFTGIRVVLANESLMSFDSSMSRKGWLGALLQLTPTAPSRWARIADGVAAAGYALGSAPRSRAIVLVVGADHPDLSTFSPSQARAYLSEVMVPLTVWRIGNAAAPDWPEGARIATAEDFAAALAALRESLGRQRIAWIEGTRDIRYAGKQLTAAVPIAGREADLPSPGPATEKSDFAGGDVPVLGSIGPDGGEVHALAASADGSVIYAGTHVGVFRSRDRGATWERASGGLSASPVRCLAVDPSDSGVVYAGTDAGLFLTPDSGEHWRAAGTFASPPITALALDPRKPARLYVGTRGRGVLWSGDGGATLLAGTLDHGDVRALAVDPRDQSVWAATEAGLFRSGDHGFGWTATGKPSGRVLALLLDPRITGRIYAGTAGDGLIVSLDGGSSWRPTKLSAAFITGLVPVPGPPAALLAASTDGVFSSTDGGTTWKLARIGAIEALVPAGSGVVLAAGLRGVLRTEPPGRKWSDSNRGLYARAVYAIAAMPSALCAGTSSQLLRLPAKGTSWESVPGIPEDTSGVFAIARLGSDSSPELLVGTSGDIGRSLEGGTSWSWVPTHTVFSLASDPAQPGVAYAATRAAVLRSEDGGLGWKIASEGMLKTFAFQLMVDPRSPSTVYAATAGSGVYRTTDAAKIWKPGGTELARSIVRSLALDPNAMETVYAGTDRGVFASTTGGRSWSPLFEGLPRAPVYALSADPKSPLTFFAGTAAGLFETIDGGRHWNAPFAGRIPAPVTSLSMDAAGDTLIAGTLGAGVFVVPLRN